MKSSADDIIRAVVDALEQRASARGQTVRALGSVRGLVANDEAEIAVDYLINTINSFRLTMRQDEYDRLMSAAVRLDYADCVTDTDPQLLVPASDDA
jgi:APA family basic amino acid/polyamine antiporter